MRQRVIALAVVSMVAAVPAHAASRFEDSSVSTSAGVGRILSDVFVTNGAAGELGGVSLEEHCYVVFAGEANARAVEAWQLANPDLVAAGETAPDLVLFDPDVAPVADPDKRGCAGTSARLVADPPGEPCLYGFVKALTGYYSYSLAAGGFVWTGSDVWTAERLAGGDAGVWATEYVCVDVFAGMTDAASFAEVLVEPGFDKSPHVTGLTGLETWVWHDFTQDGSWTMTRSFTIDARGLPLGVIATVWVDQVRWDLDGDGGWDVVADAPDSETAAAVVAEYVTVGGSDDDRDNAGVFTYLTKGVYPVTVEVVWRGTYEFVNYPGNTGVYDPIMVSSVEDYRVCELVGVLTDGRSDTGATGCPAA